MRIPARAGVLAGAVALLAAACGPSHSSISPQAKASGKAIASAIAKGQAAQQAEAAARACLRKGGTVLAIVHCAAPPGHKRAFLNCAYKAIAADIPGQESKFYTTDLENCMVRNR